MRVLYAEDDAILRIALSRCLTDWGFDVDSVRDGKMALARLRVSHFDILLTDNQMPGMYGVDLLKTIRADEQLKSLPVVVLSGDSTVRGAVVELGGVFVEKSNCRNLKTILEQTASTHS